MPEISIRPIYETSKTLAAEREVAAILEGVWCCRLEKLPMKYRFDYLAMKGRDGIRWVEIKTASQSFGEYPDYLVSLDKLLVARYLTQWTGLPAVLVVRFADCLAMHTDFGRAGGARIGFLSNGRAGREDPEDRQPCARIAIGLFQIVEEIPMFAKGAI